jgi:hypothetical protein
MTLGRPDGPSQGVFKEAETGPLARAVERAIATPIMGRVHVVLVASARTHARVERTAAPGRA